MKNLFTLLATTAIVGLMAPAYAADVSADSKVTFEAKDNGGYESEASSKAVTAGGTIKTTEKSVDVDIDADGKVNKTVETKAVTDPEGLMNRSETTTATELDEKSDGGLDKKVTTEEEKADGTNVTTETKTDVDVDSKGNVEKTVKTEKTVDPEGMLNKMRETTEVKVKNGVVVEEHKEIK